MAISKLVHYAKVFYNWRIRKRTSVPYLPEDIAVEITNVCNFKCAFCPQSDPNHHDIVPKSYLDPETADLFLSRVREAGVKTNTIHWTHDGEPFMNKQFHEICAIGQKHGFTNAYFATNGMLLSEDRINQLPKDSTYTFTIDYCSDRDYFETVRGTKGSWETVKLNIENILKNHDHINLEITDISAFSIENPDIVTANYEALIGLLPNSDRLTVWTKTFHNATGFVSKAIKKSDRYNLCPYPWTSLSVASNGDVVACCRDLQHKTVLGNLKLQPLIEIWNGPAIIELRKNLVDKNPERSAACRGCDLPYDADKFSMRNIIKTIRGRLQIF